MRTRRTDEVEAFVRVRFPTLAQTAYLVCGDRERATRLAVSALAEVTARGSRAFDEGTPTADTWRALVARLVAEDPSTAPPEPTEGRADVPAALWRAYAGLPVLVRVAIAAEHLEGISVAETALAAKRPTGTLARELAAARVTVTDAHEHARAEAGLDPSTGALEPDLAEAFRRRLDGAPLPVDPWPLLADERRRRHRRTWVAALGSAVVAAAVLAVLLALRPPVDIALPAPSASSGPGPSPSPTRSATPLTRWPARGSLVADPATQASVLAAWGPDAHVLFADDVGTARLVVGWGPTTTDSVRVAVLSGPAGTSALSPTGEGDVLADQAGVVVTGPVAFGTTPTLVLGPPDAEAAEVSIRVSFGSREGPGRTWEPLALQEGVGFVPILGEDLPAVRVRVAGYDGPPTNADLPPFDVPAPPCGQCDADAWVAAAASDMVDRIAAAGGLDATTIQVVPVATGRISSAVLRTALARDRPGLSAADLGCTAYLLPNGRVLSSTIMRTVADGRYRWYGGHLDLHPAGTSAQQPCLLLIDAAGDGSRTYVVAAPGATSMQLVATATRRYVWPDPTPTPDHVGVLQVPPIAAQQELVLQTVRADRMPHTYSVNDIASWTDPFDLVGPSAG